MEEKTKETSNRRRAQMRSELLDELMGEAKTAEELFGPDGIFTKLKGAMMQRLLDAELAEHLDESDRGRVSGNRRNGHSEKTVHTETGPVEIRVPRDRNGTFEPRVVPKHRRRIEGFDDKVLALYAGGMTVRDIQGHLRELYGTDVSADLITRVTDGVLEEMRMWQSRPLDAVYPIVYLDALFVHVRVDGAVRKRAVYIALGVGLDGRRDVLGLWIADAEGAKFWLSILTELKNRGVEDILFLCADGLTGLSEAVETAFPRTVFQLCVVHLIRASLKYTSWKDRRHVALALRPVYAAENESAAARELDTFESKFGSRFPMVVRLWRSRWPDVIPFLAYPPDMRRVLYTTNAIESLNFQLRKALKPRGHFPTDESLLKLCFLALQRAKTKWRTAPEWPRALAHFAVMFEGRLPA